MPDDTRRQIPVGLGELRTSSDPNSSLLAFGLGSCVGIAAYDPKLGLGGLAHVVLPEGDSKGGGEAKFAYPAVELMLSELTRQGASAQRLQVKIAGGASVLGGSSEADRFQIGPRNVEKVKRALAHHSLSLVAEDTGGRFGRTVELNVGTGQVFVQRGDERWELGQAGAKPVRRRSGATETDDAVPKGFTILVVDDAPFMRQRCRTLLEENGYTVIEASNGVEAVAQYKEHRPSGVFLDITMPVMDGLAALKEIRSFDPRASVSMLTAMGQQSIIIGALKDGAMDFLPKPFQHHHFLAAVEKMIAAHQGRGAQGIVGVRLAMRRTDGDTPVSTAGRTRRDLRPPAEPRN